MHAAILLVGDELLSGHTRDANGHFLAKRLNALGHRVRRISVVPDDIRAIIAETDLLLSLADVVLVSGGLGPTHDDRTTEALANRFHRRIVADEHSWTRMVERYGHRFPDGVPPATEESARKMVGVPEGAEVLENPVGAAPGYVIWEGHKAVAVFPGVPAELQAMFEEGLVGRLIPALTAPGLLEVDVFIPEASFARALGEVAEAFPDLEIGSYPHHGEPHVTLRFRGDADRARAAVADLFLRVPQARPRNWPGHE